MIRDTQTRVHIGLEAYDLEATVAFYRVLFDAEPSKTRPGYAKFEPGAPHVNLSIVETRRRSERGGGPRHYGIEVDSPQAVGAIAQRLARAGLELDHEEGVDCCYALQDKVWARDPDGNRWEVFTVLEDSSKLSKEGPSACCVASAAAGADTGGSCC